MQNLPSPRQLQYLLALDQHRNFSRAAEACLVTQSTFSAGIAALETLIGQRLINRSTRVLTFTSLGEEILSRSRSLIAQTSDLMTLARQSEGLSGPLRLGVIPTIAPYLLPSLLPALKRDWPELDLQLHEDLSERLLEKLEKGKLDLLLLAFPYATPHLRQMTVFTENFVLATQEQSDADITVDDIETMDLLLLEEGHCLRSHALDACRTQNPKIRKTYSATSLPTLIQMVRHGAGATLLPEMAARPGNLPEGIHIRRFAEPSPKREIGLVWKAGTLRDRDISNLLTTIKSCQKDGRLL